MSKVIMYHYVRSFNKLFPYFNFLHLNDFKKQNNFFSKKNSFVKINDNLDEKLNQNHFLLTFDDGLKEHLKIAKYLKKKNILGFFFIPTYQLEKLDFLPIHKIHLIFGKYNSNQIINIFKKFNIEIYYNKKIFSIFNKQKFFLNKKKKLTENDIKIYLKTILNNLDQENSEIVNIIFNYCFTKKKQKQIFNNFYLNSKDIIVLEKLGMKIGSHTHEHKVLSKMSHNEQLKDISKSIDILQNIIKKKINYFCYPYGGFKVFNLDTLNILKRKKIVYSFNVESKNWSKKSNNLYIPRYDCNEFKYGKLFNK
jgi:peptidoglycan/xylan/chitin deacetylase (PgdA/CDA1 family)